jgi:hypothetical protein
MAIWGCIAFGVRTDVTRDVAVPLSRAPSPTNWRAFSCGLRLSSPLDPPAEKALRGAKFIARRPGVMVEEAQWAAQN